jgi:NADH-quinone oxidoreductase subunit G
MSTITVQIDGKSIEVPHGTSVIEAANRLGIYVPHFCYHEKLSVAANCRMCLVEIEKTPKPMPACATPATDGMKVWTHSPVAKKAQNGVMEFLLINHPLDCPICDQGGECQLQDLAVGYGGSASRYQEEKRVVLPKPTGPLVAAEEMTRCIQCTRCVRFGQEIAGLMELGLAGRGENSEIVSFVGRAVESELSGNMIDLCPVGALTSRPFRFTARTWELARRKSVSPHDGLGTNLLVQVKQNQVMRVLPLENEEVNECWLSDKDRFSYQALNSPERLTSPMVKREGRWVETDWQQALETVAAGLKQAGADLGILATPHSTLEEMYLAAKLAKGLGASADYRLRQSDFAADGGLQGIPWLGMPIVELAKLDRVLLVGSFLRKDQPLVAHRLRQAARKGAQISVLHSVDDDLLMPVAHRQIVSPTELPAALAAIANGPIGESLKSGRSAAILLGNFAQQHPAAAQIHALAQQLADSLGAKLGVLGEAANSVGGALAGMPIGSNARAMLEQPRKAYLLLNAEPELDCADPRAALEALRKAQFVVAMSAFRHQASEYAHVMLPIAPFTETSGTFVSMEGRVQSFHPAVRALGDSRPAWKVLRVLGGLAGLAGFEQETIEEVRTECLGGRNVASLLSNRTNVAAGKTGQMQPGVKRIADVPIYFADALARRSPSLQQTKDAAPPRCWMNARMLASLQVTPGQPVLVRQGNGEARLEAALDERLPDGCVRVAAGHPSTAALGAMFGSLSIARIEMERAA